MQNKISVIILNYNGCKNTVECVRSFDKIRTPQGYTIEINIVDNASVDDSVEVFKKEVVDSFKDDLKSKRFGIEPEIVARVARGKWRIYEVGISYYGRTYAEGKKINWKDGLSAIWHIIYFNLFD